LVRHYSFDSGKKGHFMNMIIRRTVKLASLTAVAALLSVTTAGAGDSATVKIPVRAELYERAPQPLTPADCGQCHETHFNRLKNDGGRHRFACQECHASFHAYNPAKGIAAYQALMPRCDSCHSFPHGKSVSDCAGCHNDPHAIRKPVMGARLANACGECHAGPKAQLLENPSKHTKVACDKCHTSHGFKPSCSMCHQPHYQEQGFDGCSGCHPAHKPKLVTYGDDTRNRLCASCHSKVADKLGKSPSKHSAIACVTCHKARHKAVPQCGACHQQPHPQVFLEKYPSCLTCHLDPHDLPKGR
jgi:predicted CXXCH cytochrome family protein